MGWPMDRYIELFRWTILLGVTAVAIWLTVSRNTLFALGLLAGVAAGSHRTAYRHCSGEAVSTAVATLSTALFVAAVSIAIVSTWWLPTLSTVMLGYAIGVVAAWLLVSGASVEEVGPFAAIGGLLLAVVGGAGGLLVVPDLTLFTVALFGGLLAGVVVPLSGLVIGALSTPAHRQSADSDRMKPATRFGIEAAGIASVAVAVPFGSRAVALFGQGGTGWFPVGLLGGVILAVGLWAVGDGESSRLRRLHNWFVERVYRLLARLDRWAKRRRKRGSHSSLDESADDGGSEAAADGDDESLSRASSLVDQAAERVADHEFVRMAAEELDSLSAENGLADRVAMFWGRLSEAAQRQQVTAGARLQLSAAEKAHAEGDTERARSIADTALQLAAPTVGTVAAAVVRGRRGRFEAALDGLAQLFARIDELLADEELADHSDDPDQLGLIQRLLERLIEAETGEGFDSKLAKIRAAAADAWYSVQAGDQALTNEDYQRALLAYLSAIRAYRRAYDIATDAKQTATAERKAPDDADDQPADGDNPLGASAGTYATEATRLETALEALLYDTAAITIAAIDELYGEEPPPTVDTEFRRTIVRTLRVLRQTRTHIDSTVPAIALADDRYQRAEIARSVARVRRHLASADETAKRGNIGAAVEQYDRAADRLDVLSNRAGNAGLGDAARSLLSAAAELGQLANEPTPEGITTRPEPSIPTAEDKRAPEAVPASERLRRTFCAPTFVDLWEFTDDAADHPILEIAGDPFPELVGAVSVAVGSLDPLYTEPDVDSLQAWVAETALDALAAAVETVAEQHTQLCAMEPQPPPSFREPPAVLDDELAATVPTEEGVEAFADAWFSRADALVAANETITRQQSGVDGFLALEPKIRERLADQGSIAAAQVSPELLEVAAYHLDGTAYDPEEQQLSKTGAISRRDHEPAEAADTSTTTATATADDTGPTNTGPTTDSTDAQPNADPDASD